MGMGGKGLSSMKLKGGIDPASGTSKEGSVGWKCSVRDWIALSQSVSAFSPSAADSLAIKLGAE